MDLILAAVAAGMDDEDEADELPNGMGEPHTAAKGLRQ
jgi:hypothetical protein